MTITPLLLVTILCAFLTGYVGRALQDRKKKRQSIPNGTALQSYTPVWAKAAHVGRMRK